MKRPIQYFSEEYLDRCAQFSHDEIVAFVENFRLMLAPKAKSKLISLKIPEDLLLAFKAKSKLAGVPYQTQIKVLMKQWLL